MPFPAFEIAFTTGRERIVDGGLGVSRFRRVFRRRARGLRR
ncbi:hypothetical protein [Thermomonospora curvata]|uniref:Uncharacterized protein n=1 Tax=Thermomonospora curvata (strain ATCC 19995 / DSM 43183 / JCM 3096 / KCTC 9072 / NBRC 15933 / NCIMB 10081 / Henssen B9) TaxID=471852 RepID=D1ABG5_THECD|nr:hypothetical protein [Thermomonospora curvata]ACY97201.1 hypothetical protein Tcur_1625 [Thermomonospora curvata DSM 43183]